MRGTRGIGSVIAQGVRQAGGRAWIYDGGEDRTKRIAEESGSDYLYGNLGGQEGLGGMLCPFLSREDRLDVLTSNAGFETHSTIGNAEEGSMDAIYNVNTESPYFPLQKLPPALKKVGQTPVINVTSIHQKVPMWENGYYCMAKASLGMFTKMAALELAKYGIHVNSLAPGAIFADMNRKLVEIMDSEEWVPIGRVDRADELIGLAVFLVSDAPSYVTGTTLYVDGGYSEDLLWYRRLESGIVE